MKRVVIVASGESYRTADFVKAAELLRLDAVVAGDADLPITTADRLRIDMTDVAGAAAEIARLDPPPDAVVPVDDQGVVIAAESAAALGLPHNSAGSVRATRDKLAMRELLEAGGVPQPAFRAAAVGEAANEAAAIGFPVVIKPRGLSASRGVIRADGPRPAAAAEDRIRAILANAGRYPEARLLVEEYIAGVEVAVEALLHDGSLEVLAVIDKPDPLEGPFFEETLYVTPSRLPAQQLDAIQATTAAAATALGLSYGPIHAELRIRRDGTPAVIELAARSIGGLCGRAFTFGLPNEALEVLILRSAVGLPTVDATAARPSSGVLMVPIPASGTLTSVEGLDEVMAIDGIDGVEITIPVGREVTALPEGDRYLGFVFAVGADPQSVERALREAGNTLVVAIDGEEIKPAVAAAEPRRGPDSVL